MNRKANPYLVGCVVVFAILGVMFFLGQMVPKIVDVIL